MISTSDPDGVAIECPECGLRTFDTPGNPCMYDHAEPSDDGGAPRGYVECVSHVIAKADFPAHDMEDGMPVTYPVDVRW